MYETDEPTLHKMNQRENPYDKRRVPTYHLPGLFEFYEFYKVFLPLFYEKREYFYDDVVISSVYGAPEDCIWGGGRFGYGDTDAKEVRDFFNGFGISARLCFSNSLLKEEHLSDKRCNRLCEVFENSKGTQNGVIIHSDLLLDYLRKNYPGLYLVSSTTKVITDFENFREELNRDEFQYVVPDFRINNQFDKLYTLSEKEKAKVEFLCNEGCFVGCADRQACYENVSRKMLDANCPDHICKAPFAKEGYLFSRAMKSPAFIGIDGIRENYLPMGFSNFKIEGRNLGSALLLEFLLYYLAKPEHHLEIREKIYLDSMLDIM